jgi:hypothetical protein
VVPVVLLAACGTRERPWSVRLDGVGPYRFGMTVTDSAVVREGCRYWHPSDAPRGVGFMVEGGRLVRVDVDSGGVLSEKNIGVGSREAEVRAAYGSALTIQPHKYQWGAGWRYLIYRPRAGGDSLRALVFESDGQRVRTIRAGLEPQVEYVERCG